MLDNVKENTKKLALNSSQQHVTIKYSPVLLFPPVFSKSNLKAEDQKLKLETITTHLPSNQEKPDGSNILKGTRWTEHWHWLLLALCLF